MSGLPWRRGTAMLSLRWQVSAQQEPEFHRWYDQEHLADLLSIPGVVAGRRFERVDPGYATPSAYNHLTLYDLHSEQVLTSAEYAAVAGQPSEWTRRVAFDLPLSRGVYTAIDPDGSPATTVEPVTAGSAVLYALTDADPTALGEYHAWYATEHLPAICSVPGVLGGQRYAISAGTAVDDAPDGLRFLAVYELDDPEVATSKTMLANGAPTEWRRRLGDSVRSTVQVYRQIRP